MKNFIKKLVMIPAIVCAAILIDGCRGSEYLRKQENGETTFRPSASWYTVKKVSRGTLRDGEFHCKLVYTDWPWEYVRIGKNSKYIFLQTGDEICLYNGRIIDVIYHLAPGEIRAEHFYWKDKMLQLKSEDKVVYDKQPVPDSVKYAYKTIDDVRQPFWGRIFIVDGTEVNVEGKPANFKNKQLFLRKGDLVRLNEAGRISGIIWKNAVGETRRTLLFPTKTGQVREKSLTFTPRDSVIIMY